MKRCEKEASVTTGFLKGGKEACFAGSSTDKENIIVAGFLNGQGNALLVGCGDAGFQVGSSTFGGGGNLKTP